MNTKHYLSAAPDTLVMYARQPPGTSEPTTLERAMARAGIAFTVDGSNRYTAPVWCAFVKQNWAARPLTEDRLVAALAAFAGDADAQSALMTLTAMYGDAAQAVSDYVDKLTHENRKRF